MVSDKNTILTDLPPKNMLEKIYRIIQLGRTSFKTVVFGFRQVIPYLNRQVSKTFQFILRVPDLRVSVLGLG